MGKRKPRKAGVMTTKEIKQMLLEEIENKKSYPANYDTQCDFCTKPISGGEEFIFMGSKQKVCDECIQDIIDFLEE